MRVLVSGSHGLIGSALVTALEHDGHTVVRLVRGGSGPDEIAWDPEGGRLDASALTSLDAAVHLAGQPIAEKRWTDDQKRRITQSRTASTDLLARRLSESPSPPAVLINSSAIGYYGNPGNAIVDESSPPGTGFLAEVCQQWEAATAPAEVAGIRVVHVRTGVVLSPAGGALKQQLPLFRLGLGGRLGSGRQYQSWISLDDEVAAISFALKTDSLTGPVNLTAPHPVTNAEFTKTLGRVLHRPAVLVVPPFALAAVFGRQMVEEMLLASQRVMPVALERHGFQFRHPELEAALRDLLGRG
jgi:hypothetical protein